MTGCIGGINNFRGRLIVIDASGESDKACATLLIELALAFRASVNLTINMRNAKENDAGRRDKRVRDVLEKAARRGPIDAS